MAGEERDRAFEAFVAGRLPALLRTAYLVTGDEGEAQRLLRDALATTYLTWRRVEDREGLEDHVRRVMLSDHVGRARTPQPVPLGRAPRDVQEQVWWALRELTARERAVLVLASRDRLDDDEIARVLTCSRRAVQADGTRAGIGVRGALARSDDAAPADLDAEIQATLAAHADDVRPSASLVDEARDRAEQLQRQRRARVLRGGGVAAGLVVVLALTAFLFGGDPTGGAAPPTSPSPTPSALPTRVTVPDSAVPQSALALGRDTGALLASGTTIIDGATVVELPREVLVDAESGVVAPFAIAALARAEGGYVVLLAPTSSGGAEVGNPVEYVDPAGNVRRLGLSLLADQLAVSPDGLQVAFADASDGPGRPTLTVVELSGRVVATRAFDQVAAPDSVDASGVWLSLQVDPGAAPYFWELADDGLTQLAVPETQVLAAVHGTQMVVDDFADLGCQYGLDVGSPTRPEEQWSDCDNANAAAFSPTGDQVATLALPPGTDVVSVTVRDAGTGTPLARTALVDRSLGALAWTGDGRHLVLGGCCSDAGDVLTSLELRQQRSTGAWTLIPTTYRLAPSDAGVVLGAELPLPSAG